MNRRGKPYKEFKNIRQLPSGYQVVVTRKKKEHSKHFAGHSRDSLKAAQKWRDSILRKLPGKRKKAIPRSVLTAAKVKEAAVGVFHYPDRRFFQVSYRDKKGRARSKTFSWKDTKGQGRAYATAVKFRKTQLR